MRHPLGASCAPRIRPRLPGGIERSAAPRQWPHNRGMGPYKVVQIVHDGRTYIVRGL